MVRVSIGETPDREHRQRAIDGLELLCGRRAIVAIALPIFAYGMFLLDGEENAPVVGWWMIALAVVMATASALLLRTWWKRTMRRN